MVYTVDEHLHDFKFWGGAADNAAMLTDDELDGLEPYLAESADASEPLSQTQINDIFWFDFETLIKGVYNFKLNEKGKIIRYPEDMDDQDVAWLVGDYLDEKGFERTDEEGKLDLMVKRVRQDGLVICSSSSPEGDLNDEEGLVEKIAREVGYKPIED